jgi:hypothetical protein
VGREAGDSIIDGANNVAIGHFAGSAFVHASNNIAIGVPGAGNFADLSNTCFIGSIFDQPVSDFGTSHAVCVDQFNVIGDCTVSAGGKPQAMLDRKIEDLQKQVEILTAQLKEQSAQIQKVSAQLEVQKPTTKVANNQ